MPMNQQTDDLRAEIARIADRCSALDATITTRARIASTMPRGHARDAEYAEIGELREQLDQLHADERDLVRQREALLSA